MRVRSSLLYLTLHAVIPLALLVLPLAGCDSAKASTARAQTSAPTDAEVGRPPTTVLFSVVEAADTVRVHAQVYGTVTDLHARLGDSVQAGDVLMQLASPELVHLVDAAKAELAGAQALAHAARVTARMSKLESVTSLSEWEFDYQAAVASLDFARHETARRTEDDQRNMSYSLSDLEQGQSNLDRALTQLAQAELYREATEARSASTAITLSTTKREEERMVELQSKNFASASAVEEAQLSHANATAEREEHAKELAQRDEEVKSAKDEIATAKRSLEIWTDAMGHNVRGLEALRKSRAARESEADLQMQSAGARLEATRSMVGLDAESSTHALAAADAAVLTARAALRVAEQQVTWLQIVAPVDGVVSHLNVAVGELVRSGRATAVPGRPLAVLASGPRLVARLVVDAAGLANVVLGASVRVTPSGQSDRAVGGEVVSVAADESDRARYVVTVALTDATAAAPVGTVVRIEFD